MSEQWRARDSVLCGSLCFMFLVLIHQVSAVHQTCSISQSIGPASRCSAQSMKPRAPDLGPVHALGTILVN